MAPQPVTTERHLVIARLKAKAAERWQPTWESPAAMEWHLKLLEERGTQRDVVLAHTARERLIARFPHLFGGWGPAPKTEPTLTFTEKAFFFALGAGIAAGVGFFLSIII